MCRLLYSLLVKFRISNSHPITCLSLPSPQSVGRHWENFCLREWGTYERRPARRPYSSCVAFHHSVFFFPFSATLLVLGSEMVMPLNVLTGM